MHQDTIAAVSTAVGEGGIGIVRMSGPDAYTIGMKIFSFYRNENAPESHHLYYGRIVDPQNNLPVDEALIAFMRAPKTYTREDVVEINCHGGMLAVAKTLQIILAQGARMAAPGEFTQRAFLNGRLDLAQAEAVIQIIRAKSEAAMKLGLQQLSGHLSQEITTIRKELLTLLAHVEASIDYPEHQDVEDLTRDELQREAERISERLKNLLADAEKGRIIREGIKTAIVGLPNVGKSSLLNAMLRQQRAIVTAIAGTTRDVLEESVNLGGIALTIMDTAGIRATDDEVEKIGVKRSREALLAADLVLLVTDLSLPLTEEEQKILLDVGEKPCIVVANKTDLLQEKAAENATSELRKKAAPKEIVAMSILEQKGLQELEEMIVKKVFSGHIPAPEAALVTLTRHKDALQRAQSAVFELQNSIHAGFALDLLAVDLHAALEALGEITGETVGADLMDEIFSQFCIGK